MRIVIFTSNAIRHKYVANALAERADDALVIVECRQQDTELTFQKSALIAKHFNLRAQVEKEMFADNDTFHVETLPLLPKEVNLHCTYATIKDFNPDAMFVFGSSIIKEPLLSLLPLGRFINLHLGLSPYYRGSGTNFWPFVNNELDYVGSTILHIDAGIDTGDIISHVQPVFDLSDNVHTIGCKVIKSSVVNLIEIMNLLEEGQELNRVKQWKVCNERYYLNRDFNEEALLKYKQNMAEGMIEKYLKGSRAALRLVT